MPGKKIKKHEWMMISVGAFILITGGLLFRDAAKFRKVTGLLKNKTFIVGVVIIIAFSAYTLSLPDTTPDNRRIRRATKHGILGFIIAILAILEFKVAPFWLIMITSYYLFRE